MGAGRKSAQSKLEHITRFSWIGGALREGSERYKGVSAIRWARRITTKIMSAKINAPAGLRDSFPFLYRGRTGSVPPSRQH